MAWKLDHWLGSVSQQQHYDILGQIIPFCVCVCGWGWGSWRQGAESYPVHYRIFSNILSFNPLEVIGIPPPPPSCYNQKMSPSHCQTCSEGGKNAPAWKQLVYIIIVIKLPCDTKNQNNLKLNSGDVICE